MSPDECGRSFSEDLVDLLELVERSKVSYRSDARERLERLGEHIYRWNRMVNLVSRKDINRLVSYHFCDSASILAIIEPKTVIRMLDVGGSNGLPGLVLSAISPHVEVVVCDSRQKRQGFLEDACKDLGDEASYRLDRVDAETFQNENRGTFDLVVARAVTKLKLLFRWCLPLLRPRGCLVAYKGSRCLEEVKQAERYFWSHGGSLIMVVGSPWAQSCNPLRLFAIASKGQ
jgi:16S rRNA (guanine527-N7)-methyltransferase